MGRPIIGIAGDLLSRREGNPFVAIDVGFADQVEKAGGIPIVIPSASGERMPDPAQIERSIELVDGLVLVGGGDVQAGAPSMERIHPACRPMHPRREIADRALIMHARISKKPLLAVGSGMHLLNAMHVGGMLYQHLPEERPLGMPHADGFDPTHRHTVFLTPHSRLEQIYGVGEIFVNSQHHQGIKKVGVGLKSSALAGDGLVEAVESIDAAWFCVGVQWHPESATRSALDVQLFEAIVAAAEERRNRRC